MVTATESESQRRRRSRTVDGDGQLEIVVTTFDHGVDVFTVPGSGAACMPWPTGRGSLLRAGRAIAP